MLRSVVWILLILCAVVVALVAVNTWVSSQKIYRGVEAGGVDLSGMTVQEAEETFEARGGEAPETVKLDGPGTQDLTVEGLGADFDTAATVREAYEVGREGSITERASDRIDALSEGVEVAPEVDYQPEKVRAEIEDAAAQMNEPYTNASATISGSEVLTTNSSKGYELDVETTMNNVERALENRTGETKMVGNILDPEVTTREVEPVAEKARTALSGPITLKSNDRDITIEPSGLASIMDFSQEDGKLRVGLDQEALREGLDRVLADVESEAKDADYTVNDAGELSLVPARTGYAVDKAKLVEEMSGGVFAGDHEYKLSITTTRPDLGTAEARQLKPTTLLGDYRTDYSIVPDKGDTRKANLEIASNAVSQTVLAPGEVYSMNETVDSLDYESTKVIVDGGETNADGGGLCQVTSTLYNAVNYAGLDVIERHPHSSQLPYIRPGMDATVWFGFGNTQELDMKFRNNTDAFVYLREYVSEDGHIYAKVYGQPNGTQVSMRSEPVYMSRQASKWVTYQTVTKNGQVVYDGQLHRDEYTALTDSKGKVIPTSKVKVAPVDP